MRLFLLLLILVTPSVLSAQSDPRKITTITRVPFSLEKDGVHTGFSMDLWSAVAETIGRDYVIERVDTFAEMFASVSAGTTDGAIANISITDDCEQTMDFTQPIFESGLQIMLPHSATTGTIWSAILRWDILAFILIAFGILFVGGMLMWVFERKQQKDFDRTAREAMFPAFW